MTDVSQLLNALGQGDPHVASRLLPLVCEELGLIPFVSGACALDDYRRRIFVDPDGSTMMQPHDDHPLHMAINAKLAAIAGASSPPPSWLQAWSHLLPESTDEERLAVYQAVRAAGSVPKEAGFFLVAWTLDIVTDQRTDTRLHEAEERLEIVRQKYGLDEDASAESDDALAEYWEAMQQMHDAWDALYLATLEEHGEHDMARLFQDDPAQFDGLYEVGRQFSHGPQSGVAVEDDEVWWSTLELR